MLFIVFVHNLLQHFAYPPRQYNRPVNVAGGSADGVIAS